MHKFLFALAVAALIAGPIGCAAPHEARPLTPEHTAVMATVHQFVDAFNAGDATKAIAMCTDEMAILDEFSPYEWHGAGALAKWLGDYDLDAKQNGITDGVVTLATPRHIDVAADRAYVVAPADYAFKMKGKAVKESGSTFTFALHNGAAGWRVTGWAWSKN